MVKDLTDLITALDQITSEFTSQAHSEEEIARGEVENINGVASLAGFQSAAGSAETVISVAGSIRQRSIEAATPAPGSTW